VGDKWTLLIIRDLVTGCKRFSELQKSLQGISSRTLSERLSKLESEGLVNRRVYAEVPPRVEYSLTEKGEALVGLIEAMREFGERWLAEG
jgi:DNA-binding HxlR family transcriptional regulator